MYDLAIVGLGPAGSILAAALAAHFSVIAFDLKSENAKSRAFHKPCGGLLAPDAQKALAIAGLNMPKSILVDPQIFSVRTYDLDADCIRDYQRMYLNIDRHRFDLWLSAQIPAEPRIEREARVYAIEKEDAHYTLHYRKLGQKHLARARNIVGADGATSIVRRFLYPQAKLRSYTAIQQWFPEKHPHPFYGCIFDSQASDCYSWSISKDGYFIFGGAYPHKNARRLFEEQKERLARRGMQFTEPCKTEACLVLRPKHARHLLCGREGAFLVGEAAGFISPSSLEGISSAIFSALHLAASLKKNESHPLRAYRRATLPLRLKLLAKALKSPFMYQPFLRSWVMLSGIQSIKLQSKDPGQAAHGSSL